MFKRTRKLCNRYGPKGVTKQTREEILPSTTLAQAYSNHGITLKKSNNYKTPIRRE